MDVAGAEGRLLQIVTRHADSPVGLTLRAAIASIPMIGSSVSLLIEAHLSARQAARIEALYVRLAELEAQYDARSEDGVRHAVRPSERLLEAATSAAIGTTEDDRPKLFADILFLRGAGEDKAEILRKFLLEAMATLTRYEIALLLRLAPARDELGPSDFEDQLTAIHAGSPELDEVRAFSMERLQTFHLITQAKGDVRLTTIGKHLLSVIK